MPIINSLCSRLYRRAKENEGAGKLKRISRGQLISWGVVKEFNRQYFPTNAWWLFTDPSKQFKDYAVIKMTVFKGINRDIFLTRKIIEGPIDIQLEDACIGTHKPQLKIYGKPENWLLRAASGKHKGDDSKRSISQVLHVSSSYNPLPFWWQTWNQLSRKPTSWPVMGATEREDFHIPGTVL